MITTTTHETVPFVAPWREADPKAPRFMLRAGSVIERGQMEAELASEYRAGRVYGFELRAAIRAGVEQLMAEDPEIDHLLALIDAEADGEAVELEAADKRLLVEVRKALAEHWPEYRDLVAQLERRREIAPIVALRRFCVDIQGVDFSRGKDGFVSQATMAAIEPLEISIAGNRAYAMQYAVGEERNFPQPSPSVGDPPSSSPAPSEGAGSSAKKPGRKTRAPRSPRGSGRS